jgi:oligopeptide transport system permease protein
MNGRRGLWREALGRLMASRVVVASLVVLAFLCIAAMAGPALSPYPPDELDWAMMGVPPDLGSGHWLGTDRLGRDLLVRTLHGARLSLAIALLATLVSLTIGVTWGAVAGFAGGRTDALMMRFVDVLYALPSIFFVIILTVVFDRSAPLLFVAIGAVGWLTMARVVRGQTLGLMQREFIEAAVAAGAGPTRVIVRHLVPNLLGTVVVYATLMIPQMILIESFLSFLGIGIQEPQASLGNLIADGAAEAETAPWILLAPAACLITIVFCFNFLGDGLRDSLDPRER